MLSVSHVKSPQSPFIYSNFSKLTFILNYFPDPTDNKEHSVLNDAKNIRAAYLTQIFETFAFPVVTCE